MLIPENDFVALFSQFPFDALYKIIFRGDAYDGILNIVSCVDISKLL